MLVLVYATIGMCGTYLLSVAIRLSLHYAAPKEGLMPFHAFWVIYTVRVGFLEQERAAQRV